MDAIAERSSAKAEVRALFDAWLAAARAGDLDAIMSHYAPDVVSFDAVLALQFKGVEAYRQHWKACMDMCPGDMMFEPHEVRVEADGDLAVVHCVTRCGATDAEGVGHWSWMRGTTVLRRVAGDWKIAHEHMSAPFDPASGKALFDATP